jgi:general secretion pathway protein F
MPLYQYKGLNVKGKNVSGALEAESFQKLKESLKREGIFVTEAAEKAKGGGAPKAATASKKSADSSKKEVQLPKFTLFPGIPLSQIATMTKLLAVLVSAQIPLVNSLSALVDQVEHPRLKEVLIDVRDRVNEGSSFAEALRKSEVFSDLYINMIRSGEASGTLDVVLTRLAEFTENQLKVRGKLTGALMYPALMAVVGGGILFMLMTTVVPQLSKVFEDMDARLPWYTEFLIFLSGFLASYWLFLFMGAGAAFYYFIKYIRSPEGRVVWDSFLLRLPFFGDVVRLFSISRFAKTLSTLRSSNVELLQALGISRSVMGNEVLAQAIDKARDAVREGESLAAPLKRSGHFPPLVSHMIAIGEKAGRLEEMLENIAIAYQSQAEEKVQRVTTLLEPIMIVFMGGSVGFVVFAILMPIMQLNKLF